MCGITAFAWVVIRNTASVDCYNNLGLYSRILTQDVNPGYVCWRLKYPMCWLQCLSFVQGIYIASVVYSEFVITFARHTLHQNITGFSIKKIIAPSEGGTIRWWYHGPLGGVQKLHLQDLAFFYHLLPSVYIFYGIKVYKKSICLTT